MNLRQRRAAANECVPTILPLTVNGPVYAPTNKRRRNRIKGFKGVVKCCQLIVMLPCMIYLFALRSSLFDETTTRNKRRVRQFWFKHKNRLYHNLNVAITCADGTSGFKDDDYCDCLDGSDEPNTAACSNLVVQKKSFRCNGAMTIYASRVRDGVFDCPDQSDEQ